MRLACTSAAAALLLSTVGSGAVEIPQRGTDQIAHLCVVAFGGPERWGQVRDVRYTQLSTRYLPGNRSMPEQPAEVYLRYHPREQCRIESVTKEGRRQLVVYDGEQVRIEMDGKEETSQAMRSRALRTALSTLYLFALPFNLLDPGVALTYRGKAKLDGREMYRIQAAVRPWGGSSPPDTYEYYVDAESFQVPQLVYSVAASSVSYVVRWSNYRNFQGVLRPLRWDYMASERQKARTLEFQNLKLNSGLPDSLFETRPDRAGSTARPSPAASDPGAPPPVP